MPALGSSHMEDVEKFLRALRKQTRGLGLRSNVMDFGEAARAMGVGQRELRALVRTSNVLTVAVGEKCLVPASEVARWRKARLLRSTLTTTPPSSAPKVKRARSSR
jgi:hypothetical protein